jgi:hypothetical protein
MTLALFNYWAAELGKVVSHSLFIFASLSFIACYVLPLSLSAAIVCCGLNWASSPLLLLAVSHIAAAYFLLNIVCCRLLTLFVSLHEYCLLQIAAH